MKVHYGIGRRVDQLEAEMQVEEQDTADAEARAAWERELALWQALVDTMAYEHAEIVVKEIIAVWSGEKPWYGPLGVRPCRLTYQASQMVSSAFHGVLTGPLAMPPEIAQVYFDDENALPLHQCEDCGLGIPTARPGRYFETCPLCGGRTGWRFYDKKHDPKLRHLYRGDLHATA